MTTGIILILIGGAVMILGGVLLTGWASGKSRWFDSGVFDRFTSKIDRQYLDLYYVALVVGPLLAGAILIVMGLRKIL